MFPSQKAADDVSGSFRAGSEGPVRNCLDPAPAEELIKVDREIGSSSGNGGSGIDASTAGVGERQIIKNAVDCPVVLRGVRPGGGEDFISVYDPHLDEDALEWWSRDASNEGTEGNGNEAESK